jgi:hypothetical protein
MNQQDVNGTIRLRLIRDDTIAAYLPSHEVSVIEVDEDAELEKAYAAIE